MRKTLLVCLLLLACDIPHLEYGPTLTEDAVVADTVYIPEGHGSGVGFSSSGNAVITSTNIPERYAVVFRCQHGQFVIDDDDGERLYKKLVRGDRVTVQYRQEFRVRGDRRELIDLDFLDANRE